MGKECYSRSSEKTRAIENATKIISDREMKTMFGRPDSESESEPSKRPENREDASNNDRSLCNPHSAVAANLSEKRDEWTRKGKNLIRHHYVPRLVTFMPTVGDCPVETEKLDDQRRTYAVNSQQ
eukprot:8442595-Pyramimonas_sp.AAC.1